MIKVRFYEEVEDSFIDYAVIVSRYRNKWVFCKHKSRETYEVPGGRREQGELVLDTAKRELYEETGAVDYEIRPIGIYSVTDEENLSTRPKESYGMLYYATIDSFAKLPDYEMEQVVFMDECPMNMTYPLIQPILMDRVLQELQKA